MKLALFEAVSYRCLSSFFNVKNNINKSRLWQALTRSTNKQVSQQPLHIYYAQMKDHFKCMMPHVCLIGPEPLVIKNVMCSVFLRKRAYGFYSHDQHFCL